ncbi:hypothetical protein ACFQU9_17685 [Actinomadura namibiensis]|uniref:Cytochrome C biogenesis protein transmembrane region n=1 Tax=Actinomadura namibiensis TaxID=182080 RepID=A0A7W3LRN2_ACTNM|nr:hypothetical protein [Actinomadura namibiensis]MBA8953018.1 hypothetical protein [Actinomadura namibiensis]
MAGVDRVTVPEVRPVAAVPARRGLVVFLSVLAGFVLTVVWSAEFVDKVIGENTTSALLGHEAKGSPISGALAGMAFAFASGLGGTFTACNIAALGAAAPVMGQRSSFGSRLRGTVRPLLWLALGAAAVSAAYGVVVALAGTRMPQYSTATQTAGLSPRGVQAMIVFGVIGLVLVYLGLAALGLVPDPLRNSPNARMVMMGALVGGFLIGRPYGLYRQLFRDVADEGNVLYGAGAFVLQSLGNIAVFALVFVLLTMAGGRRLAGWLAARPGRASLVTGALLIAAGVFTVLYWDVRLLARRDLIWYPVAPWA